MGGVVTSGGDVDEVVLLAACCALVVIAVARVSPLRSQGASINHGTGAGTHDDAEVP